MMGSVHATPEAVSAAVHELACIERETGWSRVARVAEVLRRHGLAPSRSVLVGIRRDEPFHQLRGTLVQGSRRRAVRVTFDSAVGWVGGRLGFG